MSEATSGAGISSVPGCRFAHPGYKATVIASEAKQSIYPLAALWIASSLRSSQ